MGEPRLLEYRHKTRPKSVDRTLDMSRGQTVCMSAAEMDLLSPNAMIGSWKSRHREKDRDYRRYFIRPMDLTCPQPDVLGFVRICAFDFRDLDNLVFSALNRPITMEGVGAMPSFVVRLWSRCSGKYVSILENCGAVYGRTPYGPRGHFRMVLLADDVILLQSQASPARHVTIQEEKVTGEFQASLESSLRVRQNEDGFCTLESTAFPGHFLGMRKNGNLLAPGQVDSGCLCALFLLQKEADDLLPAN